MHKRRKGVNENDGWSGYTWTGQSMLFLDPGVSGTGFAYHTEVRTGEYVPPTETGVLRADAGDDFIRRVIELWWKFDCVCAELEPDRIVIESVEYWDASAKSHTSTVRGDTFKLAMLVGGMIARHARWGESPPLLVTPRDWKGTLDKPQVLRRIARYYGRQYAEKLRNHEGDAVGMCLAAQGGI